jgi:hypothetical protein
VGSVRSSAFVPLYNATVPSPASASPPPLLPTPPPPTARTPASATARSVSYSVFLQCVAAQVDIESKG